MVNQRAPRARTPDPDAVKDFVAGAADEDMRVKDPNAPRNHKKLTIPFNEFEWDLLEKGCELTRRSKFGLIREALIEYVTTHCEHNT